MTTVLNPSGTPTITYNRSGTTIVSLIGGSTLLQNPTPYVPVGNDGVDIPRLSEVTVLLATVTTNHDGSGNKSGWNSVFRLPPDADIGDVVEAYLVSTDGADGPTFFPQTGEEILPPGVVSDGTNNSAASTVALGPHGGCRFLKVSSSTWVVIGPTS